VLASFNADPVARSSFHLTWILTAILGCSCTGDPSHSGAKRPNILLVIVDTVRADHLGVYGYEQPVSPRIDEFANRSTLFENAISQAPHTIPSILQIMTSRYVDSVRVPEGLPTLAEIARAADYQTAAVVENANFEFDPEAHGLMRGFDEFYRNGPLDRQELNQQHWKTGTPADVMVELYDAEIRYLDQAIGELLDYLREEDLFDPTLIVLAADHGESLGDHDIWMHGYSVNDAEIHIPMIVKLPNQRTGSRSAAPAAAIDILPTIIEVAGLAAPYVFHGQSLLNPRESAFTFWKNWRVVRSRRWKLVEHQDRSWLFEGNAEENNSSDLGGSFPAVVEELRGEVRREQKRIDQAEGGPNGVSSPAVERMRALGYIP
jgi:arylsulfatase A-like enzyme